MFAFIPVDHVYPHADRLDTYAVNPYHYGLSQMGYEFQPATECTIAGWVLISPRPPTMRATDPDHENWWNAHSARGRS